jgi:hypothetical protein
MEIVIGEVGGSTYCYSHPKWVEKLALNTIICEAQPTGFSICASVSKDGEPIIKKTLVFSEADEDEVKIICEVDFSGYPKNLIKVSRELNKAYLTSADILDVWTKV